MWIDVQGAEMMVLRGAIKSLNMFSERSRFLIRLIKEDTLAKRSQIFYQSIIFGAISLVLIFRMVRVTLCLQRLDSSDLWPNADGCVCLSTFGIGINGIFPLYCV